MAEKEFGKRGRQESRASLEAIDPFSRSKKTSHSPSRIGKTSGEMAEMAEVIIMLKKIMGDIDEIKKENKELRKEIEEMNELMKAKEEKWEGEKKKMFNRIRELEQKMEDRERLDRKKNVVITGLKGVNDNLKKRMEDWMKEELGVNVEVEDAYKINEGKMMVVKMRKWEEKQKIMEKKSKLREKRDERIFIDHDLTKKEREIQKEIREKVKEIRATGKQAKVGYKKIWVDGSWHRWDGETRSTRGDFF